jgi:hypothetical protein
MPVVPRRPLNILRRPLRKPVLRLPPKPRPASPGQGPKGPPPAVARPGAPVRSATPAVLDVLAEAKAGLPERRRRAEQLLAIIEQHKAHIGADFFAIGTALVEMTDDKLYLVLGYSSIAAMVEERDIMSAAMATRLVAVVRALPRSTALQLGPDKAFEWLRLLRAEAGPDAEIEDVKKLAEEKTEVRGKPIAEMTRAEIAELRRRAQERQAAARKDPAAAEARKLARALARRLNAVGAGDARVSSRWSAGRWRVRADLELDAARALLGRIK